MRVVLGESVAVGGGRFIMRSAFLGGSWRRRLHVKSRPQGNSTSEVHMSRPLAAGGSVKSQFEVLEKRLLMSRVQGIDVSHWQGTINWASVAGAGKEFAFCKATEGINYVDPTVGTNTAGA